MKSGEMDMRSVERIPTGIPGLDQMIAGGLPIPSMTLVAGDVGTGKTTLCTQFLCQGAKTGEQGLFFVIYGSPLDCAFISTYEFVDEKYFGKEIGYVDLGEVIEEARRADDILGPIGSRIEDAKPRRVVMDAPYILGDILKEDYRKFLMKLAIVFKAARVAALVTGESVPGSPYPIELANIADGIILLNNSEVNFVRRRSAEILKMRGTSHLSGKHAVDISSRGLVIYPGL